MILWCGTVDWRLRSQCSLDREWRSWIGVVDRCRSWISVCYLRYNGLIEVFAWLPLQHPSQLWFKITVMKMEIINCVPKNPLWRHLYLGLGGTGWISGSRTIGSLGRRGVVGFEAFGRHKTVTLKTHWASWVSEESFSNRGRPLRIVARVLAVMHYFGLTKE